MKGDWSRERKWPKHKIVGTLVCEHCRKEFPAMAYQIRRKQRFCSGECRYHLSDGERFLKSVNKTDGCWEWTASTVCGRYGNFKPYNKPATLAHRYSWQFHFGEIPYGLFVLHRCDNEKCVNPDHLFLGTQLDNVRDCISKGRAQKKVLSESDVKSIRASNLTRRELAEKYCVNVRTIYDILNNASWRNVTV